MMERMSKPPADRIAGRARPAIYRRRPTIPGVDDVLSDRLVDGGDHLGDRRVQPPVVFLAGYAARPFRAGGAGPHVRSPSAMARASGTRTVEIRVVPPSAAAIEVGWKPFPPCAALPDVLRHRMRPSASGMAIIAGSRRLRSTPARPRAARGPGGASATTSGGAQRERRRRFGTRGAGESRSGGEVDGAACSTPSPPYGDRAMRAMKRQNG